MKRFFKRENTPAIAFLSFWTLYFTSFWSRALTVNDEGGLTAGHVNLWGDWAIHFTMGSSMAYRQLFLEQNPLLINSTFKYPFFVNFVSALLIRAGVPFFTAFTLPSFVFSLFTVAALYAFYRVTLGSQKLAVAAGTLYLANGGMGFLDFIKDVVHSATPLVTLFQPPHVYTRFNDIWWINVVESMIIPQRSFQLGFPMALVVLAVLYRWWGPRPIAAAGAPLPPPSHPAVPVTLGMLFGFLPIVHAHAFIAAGIVISFWVLGEILPRRRPWGELIRWWALFFIPAALVALPIIFYYFVGAGSLGAFRWAPGWYALELSVNWLIFWWRNWGPTPFAAAAGFFWCLREPGERRRQAFLFAAPFITMFAIGNLFIIHPWIWDNTKVLSWASVGISALAVLFIQSLWIDATRARWVTRAMAVFLFATMIAAGAIDLYRIQVPWLNKTTMYSNEDLYLADWVKKNTPVESIWLTGDYHNHFLFNLTGRQAVMTYLGWLWTQSYNYFPVEADVRAMYLNPDREDLLRKYKIDYVVIGRYEKEQFDATDRYAERFPVAIQTENYTIYQVRGAPRRLDTAGPVDRLEASLPLTTFLRPGLVERTYRGKYFFGHCLVKEGVVDLNFHYDSNDPKPFMVPVSIEWEGYLKVPFESRYRFSLASDDGAVLYVDDHLLIDNGGVHMIQEETSTVTLGDGFHHLKLRYFDVGGGAILTFGWSRSPAMPAQIEEDALVH